MLKIRRCTVWPCVHNKPQRSEARARTNLVSRFLQSNLIRALSCWSFDWVGSKSGRFSTQCNTCVILLSFSGNHSRYKPHSTRPLVKNIYKYRCYRGCHYLWHLHESSNIIIDTFKLLKHARVKLGMEGKNANGTAISKNLLKLKSLSDIRWHVMTRLQELQMMAVNWHSVSSPCIKLKMYLSMNTNKSAIDSWLFNSVSIKVWNTKRFQCVTMCHSNCVICHSPSDLLPSPTFLLADTANSCENVQVVCTPALPRNWCSLWNAHSFGT